jgi:enoyl-[acyl-carrier protein] reductase II
MEKLTLGGLRRAVLEGDMRHGSVMMGQVAGMCKDIRPLQDILDSLIHESEEEAVTLQQAVKELCYE